MINKLFPYYTNRRFVAAMVARSLRGSAQLRKRLVAANWRTYAKYRLARFTCNICGVSGCPFFDFPDLELRREHGIGALRETMQCRECGSTIRHRTLAAALLAVVNKCKGTRLSTIASITPDSFVDIHVLDTDAFSPISRILRQFEGYIVSSFLPDKPFDIEVERGHMNLNLEKIGLPAHVFDVVMTSDVMEHVRGVDAAHSEISRILKPGGAYIFTVPYDPAIDTHNVLVDTSGRQDVFLVPPHYHGDPITGGILAYRIFGRQIFSDLKRFGLEAEFLTIDDPAALIVGGDVFVARKAANSMTQR